MDLQLQIQLHVTSTLYLSSAKLIASSSQVTEVTGWTARHAT